MFALPDAIVIAVQPGFSALNKLLRFAFYFRTGVSVSNVIISQFSRSDAIETLDFNCDLH